MYHQVIGTAVGSIFAPSYACLTLGFLEETRLYPILLPSKFDTITCEYIIQQFYRFMDDGTTLLPAAIDQNLFLNLLNSMHPSIQYTIGKPDKVFNQGVQVQRLVFLSLVLFLDGDGNIWTDVYYKETNTHDYLHYKSHHPEHVKNNIPYVLAKRIVVFTTYANVMWENLEDLKRWLRTCGYPEHVIVKGVHNALLQGPAPETKKETIIPLISTYYSNYSNALVLNVGKQLVKNSKNP